VSNPLRRPVTAVVILSGALLALAGLVVHIRHGNAAVGIAMIIGGLALEFVGISWHDRTHLRRGEQPHAMWGTNDRNRPRWLGGPRSPNAR
jgi:fatty acid desaturase